MSKVNTFLLNGEQYHINTDYKTTLSVLIYYFNYDTLLFVLEYNKLIYSRNDWKSILITNNDEIELITIVGGG
jgi:thiamine biosynthesis protein ThiS